MRSGKIVLTARIRNISRRGGFIALRCCLIIYPHFFISRAGGLMFFANFVMFWRDPGEIEERLPRKVIGKN